MGGGIARPGLTGVCPFHSVVIGDLPSAIGDAAVTRVGVGTAGVRVMSSLNSGLQLAPPNWVRARGLAYCFVVFQGVLPPPPTAPTRR